MRGGYKYPEQSLSLGRGCTAALHAQVSMTSLPRGSAYCQGVHTFRTTSAAMAATTASPANTACRHRTPHLSQMALYDASSMPALHSAAPA